MFNIKTRIIEEANFIIDNNATIRRAAKEFNLSKSTIHKDMSVRLIKINPFLYKSVKEIMNNNLKTRHIKGGEVTKLKYQSYSKAYRF